MSSRPLDYAPPPDPDDDESPFAHPFDEPPPDGTPADESPGSPLRSSTAGASADGPFPGLGPPRTATGEAWGPQIFAGIIVAAGFVLVGLYVLGSGVAQLREAISFGFPTPARRLWPTFLIGFGLIDLGLALHAGTFLCCFRPLRPFCRRATSALLALGMLSVVAGIILGMK